MDHLETRNLIKIKMTEKVFHEIPSVKSLKDKVNILIQRHENNYFVDVELDTIDQNLSLLVRPINKVTKKNLTSTVSYDLQAKVKKIHWVLKSQEEYASEFKRKHENGEFKSFREIYEEAAGIYLKHCTEYCKSKATVSSVDGKKVFKKKTQEAAIQEEVNETVVNGQDFEKSIRERISNDIKQNVATLLEIQNLTNDQLKTRLSTHERLEEVSSITGLNNQSRKDTRVTSLTVAAILDIISKKE